MLQVENIVSKLEVGIDLLLLIPHGRSGSVLLQSLLDGHPEVLSIPQFFVSYPVLVGHSSIEKIQKFIADNPELWDTSLGFFGNEAYEKISPLGDYGEPIKQVESKEFEQSVKKILATKECHSDAELITLIYLVYQNLLYPDRSVANVKKLLIHLHGYTPNVVTKIANDFPNLKLIASIRDPRELASSYVQRALKWRNGRKSERLGEIYYYMHDYLQCLNGLSDALALLGPEQVTAIDLNDLHANGTIGLKQIAKWIGIGFDEVMTKSTINGMVWWGNSGNGQKISGLSEDRSFKNFGVTLTREEIAFVSTITRNAIRAIGYQPSRQTLLGWFGCWILMNIRFTQPSSYVNERGRPKEGWFRSFAEHINDAYSHVVFEPRLIFKPSLLAIFLLNMVKVAKTELSYFCYVGRRLLKSRFFCLSPAGILRAKKLDDLWAEKSVNAIMLLKSECGVK